MTFFKNRKIETQHQINKTYNYQKNSVTLRFTLDIENKRAIADFIELLKEATEELETQINN